MSQQSSVSAGGPWPLGAMTRQAFRKGDFLFRAGEKAPTLYYISAGSIRLPELNRVVYAGQVVGEMGLLSPMQERTASAICEEDVEVYSLDEQGLVQMFRNDPGQAMGLVQVSIKRLIENLKAETEAKERVRSELRIARDIQASMLPRSLPDSTMAPYSIHAIMEPAKEVGGDFYDYFSAGQDRVYAAVGDVSGKGVPAALYMALTKALLKNEASRGCTPARAFSRVNQFLCPENQEDMFVTAVCVCLNPLTGKLRCSNAGHPPPIIYKATGEARFLSLPTGMVLGVMEAAKFRTTEIQLEPSDSVLLYSDGVTEALNAGNEIFNDERLLKSISGKAKLQPAEIVGLLKDNLASHRGPAPVADDITLLVLRYNGR